MEESRQLLYQPTWILSLSLSQSSYKLIDFCKNRGYSILLSADTNSHSRFWGNETNTRGKKWEELIEAEHLLVHNQGRIPTFESKIGKLIIDVKLSYRLPYTLDSWRVLRSYNGTDHNTINYN